MGLMNLPSELLCQIIDLAVPEDYDGLYERSTVNLRLVNHKFFQSFAIQSVLMHQPDFFDIQVLRVYTAQNFSYRCLRALVNPRYEAMLAFTTRYLLQRPHPAPDPRANFACLVNYVVDELVKYDTGDSAINEKLRYEYMHALCRWSTPTFPLLQRYLALPSCRNKQDAVFLAAFISISGILFGVCFRILR